MTRWHISALALFGAWELIASYSLAADTALATTISAEAKSVIEAMEQARSELVSGSFTATGLHTTSSPTTEAETYGSSHFCAFDQSFTHFRCDMRGDILISVNPATELTPDVKQQIADRKYTGNPARRPLIAMFARTPEHVTTWSAIGNIEDANHATQPIAIKPSKAPLGLVVMIVLHPSCAGLSTHRNLATEYSLTQTLEFYRSRALTVTAETGGDGVVNLIYELDSVRRTLEIDSRNGFTCRRMTTAVIEDNKPPQVRQESTAVWSQKNGVWVPIHATVKEITFPKLKHSSYEFDFDWKDVNPTSIDPEIFSYRSFEGIWEGTTVYDSSTGIPINHIDTIGAPFVKIPPLENGEELLASPPTRNNISLLIANWIGAACLLAALAIRLYSQHNKRIVR